jgi:hypothetical protein
MLQAGRSRVRVPMSLHRGGNAVAVMVEALCYKPEGRGFESRCHYIMGGMR